ncbi:MAG: enoyl-CoA hydratase family protein [Rhizobiaceae bacterium]|nr:enoyl-CoA hydratase family protein [Rhizobiaceae bacterium]
MKSVRVDDFQPRHFKWEVADRVATITLNRPERKNPLTFDSYGELCETFRALRYAHEINAVVLTGAGGNFCSGGDVHEIIGPMTRASTVEVLEFARLTGDVIKAMLACPQVVIAAVDGVCAGAGALLSLASDFRFATQRSKTSYLFARVGLAGCDMGACAMLPRLIGQGRAAELLYTGRAMTGDEGERWGFFNQLCEPEALLAHAQARASEFAHGPHFAHSMTKKMLQQEWNMSIDQAIEAEAQAQTICMRTEDFARAYRAFVAKEKPQFQGN